MKQSASALLDELLAIQQELDWLELKCNNSDPIRIGEYISALANTALLLDRDESYLIFGVEDDSKNLVGTEFRPYQAKHQNQALMMWLASQMTPHVEFTFDEIIRDSDKRIVILTVKCPVMPVSFNQVRYIRIGNSKTRLSTQPVDGGINAQQIGRQQNFTYQKERAAGYGSPFLLVF